MPQPSRLEVTSDKMSKSVSFPQKMFLLPFLRFPARNGSSSFPFFADGQLSGKGEDAGEGRAGEGPATMDGRESFFFTGRGRGLDLLGGTERGRGLIS